ncbi:hypothetical protein AKO1_008028 [Acrasis kona]|uniref:Uncharacterized protein n=1 Tax=Acrasis kona TaxID=1008807 RepID=A0AAW2YNZ7_9EUKA
MTTNQQDTQRTLEVLNQKLRDDESLKKIDEQYNQKLNEVQNLVNLSHEQDGSPLKVLFFKYLSTLQENRTVSKDKVSLQAKVTETQSKLDTSIGSRATLFRQISLLTEQVKKQDELIQKLVAENRSILEQHEQSIEAEHVRREEIQKGFQAAVDEIHVKLQEQAHERLATAKENELMTVQLETMTKTLELRDQQYETEIKKADLEKRLVKHKMEERLKESEQGEHKVQKLRKKLEFKSQEANEYKKQLNQYSQKYIEIKKTISESGKTFEKMRSEFASLKSKNDRLEREKVELMKMLKETKYATASPSSLTSISTAQSNKNRPSSPQVSQQQQRQTAPSSQYNNEDHDVIDINATPQTIIDIQTPLMFSPIKVNEDMHAQSSLLRTDLTNEEDLNDVDL